MRTSSYATGHLIELGIQAAHVTSIGAVQAVADEQLVVGTLASDHLAYRTPTRAAGGPIRTENNRTTPHRNAQPGDRQEEGHERARNAGQEVLFNYRSAIAILPPRRHTN